MDGTCRKNDISQSQFSLGTLWWEIWNKIQKKKKHFDELSLPSTHKMTHLKVSPNQTKRHYKKRVHFDGQFFIFKFGFNCFSKNENK